MKCDMKDAFIIGTLDDITFMKQAESILDLRRPRDLCKLLKFEDDIRGKTSRPGFYEPLNTALGSYRLNPWRTDPAVLHGKIYNNYIWVVVYVDGVLLSVEGDEEVKGVI